MPIEIYSVANLDWDNGSYKVPNAIPTVFKDKKTVEVVPSIANYYGGSIPLTGDHWNWAKYNGVYYFLKRDRPLDTTKKDPKKHRWLYYLVRDHWTNSVLLNKVVIKGDISTWNIEKDIEENLNRTSLIIENPLGIARVCFEKADNTWRNALYSANSRKPITALFKEVFLTKGTIDFLLKKVNLIKRFKTVQPHIYKSRRDIFLFANLKPTYANSAWKEEVSRRVNEALRWLPNNNNAFIGKVEFQTGGYNALSGHYCFTYENDAIGNRDETVQINSIDLSKVTDIKKVSWDDLESTRIDNLFTVETALLDIDISGRKYDEEDRVFKLSQRNYLPLGEDVIAGRWKPPAYLSDNWLIKYPGQKVKLKKADNPDLTLYFVDQINFFLSWYVGPKGKYNKAWQDREFREGTYRQTYNATWWLSWARPGLLETIDTYAGSHPTGDFFVYGYTPSPKQPSYIAHKEARSESVEYQTLKEYVASLTLNKIYYRDRKLFKQQDWNVDVWTPLLLPHVSFKTEDWKEQNLWNKFVTSPSYGFLIWQIRRPSSEWRLFEYLGDKAKNTLDVITGIKQFEVNKEYGSEVTEERREWWRRVTTQHPLSKFTGQEEFARLYLDLWQLNFLHFFPNPNDKNEYENEQAKCDMHDKWFGVDQFLYQRKECEITRLLDENNLKDLDGNKVDNPWIPEKYSFYAKTIENRLDNVVIKDEIELPQPLEKGDYLISTLEYRWDNYDYRHWTNRKDAIQWIKPNTWEAQSINLLEDFAKIKPDSKTIRDVSLEDLIGWKDKDASQIFLGSDLDGDIAFFTATRFECIHRLSNSPDQFIEEVDGQDNRRINYYHFKKTKINIDDLGRQNELLDLIALFYEVVANRNIRKNQQDKTIHWDQLKLSDLDNKEGNLFDLVGSDWYVFIRGDKTHFIYKKSKGNAVTPLITNISSFKYPSNPDENSSFSDSEGIKALSNLPLIAKVNQINTLYYKSYPITIKTKFLFDKNKKDSVPIATVEGIKTEDNPTNFDYHMFRFISDHDNIDQIINLSKKPVKGRAIADQATLDALRIEGQRIALDNELQRRELGLNQTIAESGFRRQEFDLSLDETYKRINDALQAGQVVTGLATGPLRALPFIGQGLSSFASQYGQRAVSFGVQAGVTSGPRDRFGLPKLADATMGGLLATPQTINNSVWYNNVMPEKARRIEEDKQFKFQQLAFNSYKIDHSHRENRLKNALAINRLAHEWVKEPVNDAFLSEKWIEKKKVSDFYMVVRYPTGIQLEQLKTHVDQFGIDIDLPDRVVTLRAGMTPNVIRMTNIAVDDMIGIENLLDREYLSKRLESGIKIYSIEEAENTKYDYFETSVFLAKIKNYDNLEHEVQKLKEELEQCQHEQTRESKESQQLRRFLINKLEDPIDDIDKLIKDLADLEEKSKAIEAEPDKYNDDSKKLIREVYEVLNRRLTKAQEIAQKQNQLRQQKEEAEKRAEDAENKKEKAEDERDKAREELNNAHNKERSLLNENQALQTNLKNTREQLEHEKVEKLEKEEELSRINKKFDELNKQAEKVNKRYAELIQQNRQIQTELGNTKRQLEQTKGDLAKCRAKTFDVSTLLSKTIRGWSYCDFLKTFNEIGWDYDALYKVLIKTQFYGLTSMEFYGCNGVPTLQAIQQTVEECEDMLDNNTSILPQDNNALREFLLTEEGADKIRGLKRYFISIWKDIWLAHRTENEHIDLSKIRQERSKFYDKDLPRLNYGNERVLKENTNYYVGTKISVNDWVWKNAFWQDNYNKWTVSCYALSFRWFGRWFTTRYIYDTSISNLYNWDQNVYNSYGYYDIYNRRATLAPLFSIAAYWIVGLNKSSINSDERDIFSIAKKRPGINNLRDGWFSVSKAQGAKWTYSGFTNRRCFIGYQLVLASFIHENAYEKEMTNHDFQLCCETFTPGTIYFMKKWLIKLGMTMQEWNEQVLYQLKIAREVLCNSKSWEEAQQIVEDELAAGIAETDSEARLRERKIKEEYPQDN